MASKTPVTVLHELLQRRNQLATYNLVKNEIGVHNPEFAFEVVVEDKITCGYGSSKKQAKHAAAQKMVELLQEMNLTDLVDGKIISPYEEVVKENYVGQLQDYCTKCNFQNPEYELIRDEGLSHAKIFCFRVTVSSLNEQAEARTKKSAKHQAAFKMLDKLKFYFEDTLTDADNKEEIDETTKLAVKKLQCSEQKESTLRRSQPLGLMITNYYKAFQDPNALKSPLLESFKEMSASKINELRQDAKTYVKNILMELDAEDELDIMEMDKEKEGAGVALTLYTLPKWTFLGQGKNESEAILNAYDQAFNFMITMSS